VRSYPMATTLGAGHTATLPQSTEPSQLPQTLETHPHSGQESLRLVTVEILWPAVPTLQHGEAAGNTSDVDVDE
jgi:hypothetical protein